MIGSPTAVVLPFSLRVEAGALTAFDQLSPRERDRLNGLDHRSEETLTWLNGESVDTPHDLWVLHQWSEPSRTMGILAIGRFPIIPPASRAPEPDEHRWDNEGGRNPIR